MSTYLIPFLLLIFQTSVFIKYFSVYQLTPDLITIYIILYTLNKRSQNAYKMATVVGLLQDILSSLFPANLIIKNIVVTSTLPVKKFFFTSGFYLKVAIIVVLSAIDISFKLIFTFFKTGIFYISPKFILYILLNFLIFGVYYIINEYKKG